MPAVDENAMTSIVLVSEDGDAADGGTRKRIPDRKYDCRLAIVRRTGRAIPVSSFGAAPAPVVGWNQRFVRNHNGVRMRRRWNSPIQTLAQPQRAFCPLQRDTHHHPATRTVNHGRDVHDLPLSNGGRVFSRFFTKHHQITTPHHLA